MHLCLNGNTFFLMPYVYEEEKVNIFQGRLTYDFVLIVLIINKLLCYG